VAFEQIACSGGAVSQQVFVLQIESGFRAFQLYGEINKAFDVRTIKPLKKILSDFEFDGFFP
jgi:hypothetical protein